MSHLTGETLVARVDDELLPLEHRQTEHHLAACSQCRARAAALDETRALFAGALQWIDDDEPAAWASPLVDARTADRGRPAALPIPLHAAADGTSRWRFPAPALRWAAGVTLLAAATAAAAVMTPGLISRLLPDAAVQDAMPPAPANERGGAVAVAPVGGAVEVALTGAARGTRVRIALHDRSDVLVEYTAAVPPRFIARDGYVAMDLGERAAVLRIAVPRGLRTGRISIDGSVVAVLEQGRVVSVRGDPDVSVDADSAGG